MTDEIRKVFNYRLSRAQRIIGNTFRVLVSRLRIFQKPIEGKPEFVEKNVLAITALYSYLQTDKPHYTPAGFVDSEDKSGAILEGQWRELIDSSNIQSVRLIRNFRYAKNALQIREVLADLFVSENGSAS